MEEKQKETIFSSFKTKPRPVTYSLQKDLERKEDLLSNYVKFWINDTVKILEI